MEYKYDISIIIPAYNTEDYIDECITSIINQTFDLNRIQIILINDGSSDNSLEVMKKYERDNILVIDKKNTGVSDSRNIGLKKAEGKYILFLDSDDYLSEEACENLFNFFEENYDEIDLVTYPIVYDKNGNKSKHIRYKTMYYKGTGVYDLKEDYNLIQATVNVVIKNKFKDNPCFEVKQSYSEDERFVAGIIMEKEKIGFCEEATYFYRRHNSAANDNFINPLYTFEMITSYYEDLFKTYKKKGKVPKYIQMIYLNTFKWRLLADVIYPYHYEKAEYDKAIKRIKKLLNQIDTEVISSLKYVNVFHQVYILKMLKRKIEVDVNDEGEYVLSCDDVVIEQKDKITCKLSKFREKNDQVTIEGYFNTPLFECTEPKIYLIIKNKDTEKKKKLKLEVVNNSYYASKVKTNTLYGFKLKFGIKEFKKLEMYAEINKTKIPIKFVRTSYTSNRIYKKMRRVYFEDNKFISSYKTPFALLKDLVYDLNHGCLKQPAALVYRFLAIIKIKRQKIWLYSDKSGSIDNAYYQFKHDIKKKDGVKRYYIYYDNPDYLDDKFLENEKKYLLKFRSLKHKILFLKSDKVLTSFSSLQTYCPFNKGIKFYRDIMRYDFVYLQHGILHANLLKMYSREFTEISNIVISSNFERENLINKYHYKKEELIESGMPRMELKEENTEVQNKILYAPSWRQYLIGNLVKNKRTLKPRKFLESTYFKENYKLLHSKELEKFLKENNLSFEFKLHPIFEDYAKYFEADKLKYVRVSVGNVNVHEYKLFITDFSSFQFDFVKLKRPIIYFLPDEKEFKAGLHTYRELDLPYDKAFGNLCLKEEDLFEEIKRIVKNNYKVDNKFKSRMDKFFVKIDKPCERIYEYLMKN